MTRNDPTESTALAAAAMPAALLPPRTGEQYSIAYGEYRAVITQMGATLRKLTYQGEDVIVSLGADDVVRCREGQILVPFPSRIADGTYTFDGSTYQLPIDEHDRNTAIHGYGYRHLWSLVKLTESAAVLQWRIPNMEGYPFDLLITATYLLDEQGMHISITAKNYGPTTAPWALAIHPWLANGKHSHGDAIDADNAQCRLMLPARTHVTVDDRLLPTGTEPVDGTKFDLRGNPLLTEQPFDDAFTDLERNADGSVSAVFTRPDGLQVTLGGDESVKSFQVCTGTGFPAYAHPTGVAVEPSTAYANAFNTGIDLIRIQPGEHSTTSLFLRASRA